MPSSNRSVRRRFPQLILIAALALVSRAPFLLHGDRFFDSDEAVEGLMARHVLQGEHPVFLWGQHYKGVPEVYVASAAFALAGPSVVALKSVTLFCFVMFVCVQFVLADRLFSRGVAWLATAFLLVCPPAFVLWSLSANAEIVLTLLAGTVMYLGVDIWRRTGSRTALASAAAAAGFGLWVQQYIIYYIVALALALAFGLPRRRELLGRVFAIGDMPAWFRWLAYVLGIAAFVYLVLGTVAFATGGFDVVLGGVVIGVHRAQKLWNIAASIVGVWAAVRGVSIAARHPGWRPAIVPAVLAFVAGYAPALAARLAGGGSAPVGNADLARVAASLSPVGREILPIVFGFRSPTTGWLGLSAWLALAPAVAIAASFVAIRRSTATPVLHLLVLTAPVLFLLSGSFVDAQSYRYLMPTFGALSIVMAVGVAGTLRWSRAAGVGLLVVLLTLFGLEQRNWYQTLAPDTESAAIMRCLDEAGARTAYADYWISYKVTFLSGERIVVSPNRGLDRYPPYTAQVRAEPTSPTIAATMSRSCASILSPPR
jgi:hypothetical protein